MNFKEFSVRFNPIKHPNRPPLVIPRFRNGKINWNLVPKNTKIRWTCWEGKFSSITRAGLIEIIYDDGYTEYAPKSEVIILNERN